MKVESKSNDEDQNEEQCLQEITQSQELRSENQELKDQIRQLSITRSSQEANKGVEFLPAWKSKRENEFNSLNLFSSQINDSHSCEKTSKSFGNNVISCNKAEQEFSHFTKIVEDSKHKNERLTELVEKLLKFIERKIKISKEEDNVDWIEPVESAEADYVEEITMSDEDDDESNDDIDEVETFEPNDGYEPESSTVNYEDPDDDSFDPINDENEGDGAEDDEYDLVNGFEDDEFEILEPNDGYETDQDFETITEDYKDNEDDFDETMSDEDTNSDDEDDDEYSDEDLETVDASFFETMNDEGVFEDGDEDVEITTINVEVVYGDNSSKGNTETLEEKLEKCKLEVQLLKHDLKQAELLKCLPKECHFEIKKLSDELSELSDEMLRKDEIIEELEKDVVKIKDDEISIDKVRRESVIEKYELKGDISDLQTLSEIDKMS